MKVLENLPSSASVVLSAAGTLSGSGVLPGIAALPDIDTPQPDPAPNSRAGPGCGGLNSGGCPYIYSWAPDGVWSLVLVWLICPVIDDPGGVAARSPGCALTADRGSAQIRLRSRRNVGASQHRVS